MKGFFLGVLVTVILVVSGLFYRSAVEHPGQPIACPLDALVCPDGTSVARIGFSCSFPPCPPPNISLPAAGIAFALPPGFTADTLSDTASVAVYSMPITSSTEANSIIIRHYAIEASSTALATIQQTAIGGASGEPVSVTSFTSTMLGTHRFTVVSIERFEGVIDTAYYLARGTNVLRFDAIDRGADWTNPNLDISTLPAHSALRKLLTTLQGE
jgi:hypothetical protein